MLGDKDMGLTIAVKDLERAKKFYGDTLGLKLVSEEEAGAFFKSGNTNVLVYPSQYAGSNKATCGGWTVDDIEATIKELEGKGVTFEEYDDMPGTREGAIHSMGSDKVAWFKDPDGNILAIDNSKK